MTEALTLLVAIAAAVAVVAIIYGGFFWLGCCMERWHATLGGYHDVPPDLRAQHELKRLIAGEGEGCEPVHTHFDTTKG